jgi:hypothetical protein
MLPLEKEYLDYIDNLEIDVDDLPGELPMMARFIEQLAPGHGARVTIALARKYTGIRYKWPSLRYIDKKIISFLNENKEHLLDDESLPYGRDNVNYEMLQLFADTINEVLPGKGLHLVLLLSRAFAGGDTRWHNVNWFFAQHRRAWILNRYDREPSVTVRELAIATGLSQGTVEKIIAKGPANNLQLTLPWC